MQPSPDTYLVHMALLSTGREGKNHYGQCTFPVGSFGKPVGSWYGHTTIGSSSALSLDERKDTMSSVWFKHLLTHTPSIPYGNMEFLPCNLSGAVRRHFLPNYSSCIMNNCTESPSAASWPVCWALSVLFECHINKEMGHFLFSRTICHFT